MHNINGKLREVLKDGDLLECYEGLPEIRNLLERHEGLSET